MRAIYIPSLRMRGLQVRLVDGTIKIGPAELLTPKMLSVCEVNKLAIISELLTELHPVGADATVGVTADGRDSIPVSAARRIESSGRLASGATCANGHPVTLYSYDCSDVWSWYECVICGDCQAVEVNL